MAMSTKILTFSHTFHTIAVENSDMRKSGRNFNRALAIALFSFAIILCNTTNVFAETTLNSCQVSYSNYVDLRNNYLANLKPSGADYKELTQAFKRAESERARCLQIINKQYRDELEAIKNRYQGANKSKGKNSKVQDKTQQSTEISNATIKRDEAIKQLAQVPNLPERKAR